MWETLKDVLLVLLGACISIAISLIDKITSRTWELEDRKRDRVNDAPNSDIIIFEVKKD